MERFELSSTLRRIEYGAFENCESLRSIDLPEGLEYVGEMCFAGSSLESVRLPPAMKVVEKFAFY